MSLRASVTKPAVRKACTLHITDAAAAFLDGIIVGRNEPKDQICLALVATQEDGQIRYTMRLAEISSVPEFLRLTVQGIEMAVEPGSIKLLDGAEIGFIGGAITVANPNAQSGADEMSA